MRAWLKRALGFGVAAGGAAGLVACSLFFPFEDYEQARPPDACVDGACAPDASPACDANLQIDAEHCGACGHSCLGRMCIAGLCEPEILATDAYAAGIALDGDSIFVGGGVGDAGGGGVVRVPKIGPGTQRVATASAAVFRVVSSGAELYWTQGGIVDAGSQERGIGRVSKAATGSFVAPFVADQDRPYALAHDDTHVFWTNFLGSGDVWRAAKQGAPSQARIALPASVAGVAVDATHVYFTTCLSTGAVMRANKDGSNVVVVAPNQPFPLAIFVDDTNVYWTNYTASGSVMRVAKSGGTPAPLATGQNLPNVVAADETNVYWSNGGPPGMLVGSVNRAPRDGGKQLVLAVLTAPADLAIDASHVYWASAGVLFRVPK
jgi:hypothetical protein